MTVVEVSSTRAARPRRLVDLLPVLMESPSNTSMATRAQNIVELYGVLPTVTDDVDLIPFSSFASLGACSQGLACPPQAYGSSDFCLNI